MPRSEYYYKFDETIKEKQIIIDKLEPEESITKYYEIQVNNLPDNIEEQSINSFIKASVEEENINYEFKNTIKPAEAKIFLKNFLELVKDKWSYTLTMESEENKQGEITVKLPKEYELEGIAKDGEKLNIEDIATINNNIVTMQV